jgi:phosphoglycerol transferase MdoB-like AlkP superfamily enzyme
LNIPFLAINFIDLGYFRITGRRSTVDLLFVLKDSLSALPAFLKSYWYLFLLFILIMVVLTITAKRIIAKDNTRAGKTWYIAYAGGLVVIALFGMMARGTAARPLFPATPLLYFDAEYQPLVNNSTFSFLYSLVRRQTQLQIKSYYTNGQLDSLFTIRRQYPHQQPFQKKNVVIFILESFCREELEAGNLYRAKTPFLDSIIRQSTWCSNAFANALESNHGIVAVLAGMPPLLDEPYFHSVYNDDKIRGIGTILKEQGYSTHFFMGAGPDHFGFGKFSKMMGIDHYHSGDDFNDDQYFDGNWGIYDHRFLPWGAGIIQKEKEPFLAVFFNISSHYPFKIPSELQKQFDYPGEEPFSKSVGYVDYSLRLFFDSIKNSPSYKNTLFVFTADHSIITFIKRSFNPFYSYRIPVFIFDPADPVYNNISRPVQQTDLVPTILDKLSYSGPFMSFGRSIYDTAENYVVNNHLNIVQVTDNRYMLGFNTQTNRPAYLYSTTSDSSLKIDLLDSPQYAGIKNRLLQYDEAVVQRYNNSLIQDSLFIK